MSGDVWICAAAQSLRKNLKPIDFILFDRKPEIIDITSRIKTSRNQAGSGNYLSTIYCVVTALLHRERVARAKTNEEWVARNAVSGQTKNTPVQHDGSRREHYASRLPCLGEFADFHTQSLKRLAIDCLEAGWL